MKIEIKDIKETPTSFMRTRGYYPDGIDERTGELRFVRPLAKQPYPRFHIYGRKDGSTLYLNLHLDQKKPSYSGSAAHGGEYEGPMVEQEAKRIQEQVNTAVSSQEADPQEADNFLGF